jgi:hypothetical protein
MAIDKTNNQSNHYFTPKTSYELRPKKTQKQRQQQQQHHPQQDEEGQGDSERNPPTPNTRKWLENGKKWKNTKGLK